MTASEALTIMAELAQGNDPITGKLLPVTSHCRHPDVVRAFFLAAEALEKVERREEREQSLPPQAGCSWSEGEDRRLCEAFDAKVSIQQLARMHHRTTGAIKSRLAKLGKTLPAYT